MIALGDKVKDRISGREGIATGRAEYLYGCVQVLLSPLGVKKDGSPHEACWYDEDRLSLVKAHAEPAPKSAATRAGGPQSFAAPIR